MFGDAFFLTRSRRRVGLELVIRSQCKERRQGNLGGDEGKWLVLLEEDGCDRPVYLSTGTRRRSSSKKFSRKITWLRGSRCCGVSAGMRATMRLPSGDKS